MTSINRRFLFVWLVCVIAGTLVPFNFAVPPMVQEHGLKAFQFGSYERDPIDFVLNLLLFIPFGALLHREGRYRSVTLRSVVILAGTGSVLISGIVEYFQAFLPLRDSSLIDVFANTSGALMGVAAAQSWGAPVEARVHRLRVRTSPAMLAGVIAGFLVVALVISGALQTRTRLSNWSPEHALLIGNETTGDRPWRGRVFALAITDGSMPLASVRRFSAGESIAQAGVPIAAFDFKGGSPYRDAAGNLPDLEWTERQNTTDDSGIELSGHSWLRTVGPASRLANRLRHTNAFTLRVQCATDDTHQDGPARIVANGNFTLGQQGGDLVFRLRTPAAGVNGSPLEVLVPGVFSDRLAREILVTYDGATLLVARADGNQVSRTELTPGAGVALAIPSLDVRSHELQIYKVAYIAIVSLVPGVLVGLLGHTSRVRQLFAVGWVLAFAVLLEATLVGVSGRAFDWGNVAVTAGVAAVVLMVSGVTLPVPGVRWRASSDQACLASREIKC